MDTITSALVDTQHHQQPPPAPTIDALKDDVFLKPIIAPTIAENITLMRLSYTHFSRLDTHCVNFGWFSPILALVFFSSNTNCLHL